MEGEHEKEKRTDDAAAFEKLMWERQYLGGRFPEPSEEPLLTRSLLPNSPLHRRHLMIPSPMMETVRTS